MRHTSQVAHQAGAYSSFCSIKLPGVFLLPFGWDASPSQGYPQHQIRRHLFIHLGGERHRASKVSCPCKNTTQCPRPGIAPGALDPESRVLVFLLSFLEYRPKVKCRLETVDLLTESCYHFYHCELNRKQANPSSIS